MITHVENLGANITNCSFDYFLLDHHYRCAQIFLLAFLLLFIVTINLLLIVIILTTDSLRGCTLCLQLTASLIGNDIYYTKFWITSVGCHRGVDEHSLLYMLMMNTRFRYLMTIKIQNDNNDDQRGRTLRFILQCWTPAFLVSLGLALAASAVENLITITYNFLVSVGISFPPIIIVVVWNILLGKFLTKSKRNSAVMQQESSRRVIEQATIIINATIIAHVMFLFIGCATSIIVTFYMDSLEIVIAMNWLRRLSYVTLFTVEAIVYTYKGTK